MQFLRIFLAIYATQNYNADMQCKNFETFQEALMERDFAEEMKKLRESTGMNRKEPAKQKLMDSMNC